MKHIHLGPPVYLYQDRNIFLSVRVYRRVQSASQRVHKVTQGLYAESGYPLPRKSAVRRSECFGGSTRSLRTHSITVVRVPGTSEVRDFTASLKGKKMLKSRLRKRPKRHWRTNRQGRKKKRRIDRRTDRFLGGVRSIRSRLNYMKGNLNTLPMSSQRTD